MSRDRLELLSAIALIGIAAGPFLLGGGVDFPDDAIYHSLPLWEWMEFSFRNGHSPWFMPGKLGGISLAADSVPMGPLYPACWLLWVFPARIALPLAMLLHAIGTLLAVRWLARTVGASSRSATLAGAGVTLGTTGLLSFIDCQADTMPLFLWFPVALACLERLDTAVLRSERLRWACLAAGAVGLILLGAHLRWAAATGAALVLWCLIRRPCPAWSFGALTVGLAAGLPGYLPQLLEWRESALSTGRLNILQAPPHDWIDLWNIAGLLAPKPIHLMRDHSIGVVLGVALLLLGWRLRGPAGRLAVFALLLYLAPASTGVPGLRFLFAPLLVLTHPINIFYAALATLPAAVAGAVCLDRLIASHGGGRRTASEDHQRPGSFYGPGRYLLAGVVGIIVLRAALPDHSFSSDFEWGLYLLALGQALGVSLAMLFFLKRGGSALPHGLFVLALVDLASMGLRFHLALPSTPLPWTARTQIDDSPLRGGYIHLTELADLEPFQYDSTAETADEIVDAIREQSARVQNSATFLQDDLLERRWPVHLGLARGLRSGSGVAKMPPRRAVVMLSPLASALVSDPVNRARLEDVSPETISGLFASPSSIGQRTLRLFGLRTAVGPGDMRFEAEQITPRCYLPTSTRLVPDERERIRLLLESPMAPQQNALLEHPVSERSALPADAQISCPSADTIIVRSSEPVLAVLRERHHPGWRVKTEEGSHLTTFPVNQVHMGVIAPGNVQLRLSFAPPGMKLALASSGGAWLLLLFGLIRSRAAPPLNSSDSPQRGTETPEGECS